nr:retrovirus-related Pol polyprotein from transposon TNT 1-94 [Tanacetum cinerariifolium]
MIWMKSMIEWLGLEARGASQEARRGRGYDRGHKVEQKQVEIMEDMRDKLVASRDKEVNMEARDSDDTLVCCVENTVEDSIVDSGASFHATYCKEELERFKPRFVKVCLADDKTLDITGIGDVVLKTSFGTPRGIGAFINGIGSAAVKHQRLGDMSRIGMSMLASKGNIMNKDVALHLLHKSKDPATMILLSNTAVGVTVDSICGARSTTDSSSLTKPIQKSQMMLVDIPKNLVENDIIAAHGLSSEITQSLGGNSNTSERSKNNGSFEDSGRSHKEYSEDGASYKEGGFETLRVRRSTESPGLCTSEGFQLAGHERKSRVHIKGNSVRTDSSTEATVDDMLVAGSDMAEFNKPKWEAYCSTEFEERIVSLARGVQFSIGRSVGMGRAVACFWAWDENEQNPRVVKINPTEISTEIYFNKLAPSVRPAIQSTKAENNGRVSFVKFISFGEGRYMLFSLSLSVKDEGEHEWSGLLLSVVGGYVLRYLDVWSTHVYQTSMLSGYTAFGVMTSDDGFHLLEKKSKTVAGLLARIWIYLFFRVIMWVSVVNSAVTAMPIARLLCFDKSISAWGTFAVVCCFCKVAW